MKTGPRIRSRKKIMCIFGVHESHGHEWILGREEGAGEKSQIQLPSRLHKPSQPPGKERLESPLNQFHNRSTRLFTYNPVPYEIGVARGKEQKHAKAIRNRTVQKILSTSDMFLKFFFIALNSKTDWTLQNLPTEIVIKKMERFNLHLQSQRMWPDRIVEPQERGAANHHNLPHTSTYLRLGRNTYLQ